ncbi:MAG: MFS transporter [Candidatus Riflebacteria bacterium]|nr:MFS transporter [Candidatus Riflebacteria bacterium]
MKSFFLIIRTFNSQLRLILCAQALVGLGMGVFTVLLNIYLKSLGLNEGTIGRLLAAQALSSAIASFPFGRLADRYSRKAAYISGISLLTFGFFIAASVEKLDYLWFAAIISGCGNGGLTVSVLPFLQENSRRRQRTYLFSVNFSISLFMGILAGFIAGWLPVIYLKFGLADSLQNPVILRGTLFAAIVFLVASLIPASRMSAEKIEIKTDVDPGKTDVVARAPWLLISKFMITYSLIGFGAGLIVPYFNLYFHDWTGATVPQIGMVFAIGQLGTALGGIFSPWFSKSIGLTNSVVLTEFLSLPFMLIMAYNHSLILCGAAFFFRGAFMNMAIPIRQRVLMERIPPKFRGLASASETASWSVSWAISMMVSGDMIQNLGYAFCLHTTFVLYLVSALLYWYYFRE